MESVNQDLLLTLRNVLTQLPSLLTLLICLVIALVRWKRHPKVSLIASLAFVSLMLHGLISSATYIWLPRWLPRWDQSERAFFSALTLITNSLFAVLLATLLVAIFIDRRPASE